MDNTTKWVRRVCRFMYVTGAVLSFLNAADMTRRSLDLYAVLWFVFGVMQVFLFSLTWRDS